MRAELTSSDRSPISLEKLELFVEQFKYIFPVSEIILHEKNTNQPIFFLFSFFLLLLLLLLLVQLLFFFHFLNSILNTFLEFLNIKNETKQKSFHFIPKLPFPLFSFILVPYTNKTSSSPIKQTNKKSTIKLE